MIEKQKTHAQRIKELAPLVQPLTPETVAMIMDDANEHLKKVHGAIRNVCICMTTGTCDNSKKLCQHFKALAGLLPENRKPKAKS